MSLPTISNGVMVEASLQARLETVASCLRRDGDLQFAAWVEEGLRAYLALRRDVNRLRDALAPVTAIVDEVSKGGGAR